MGQVSAFLRRAGNGHTHWCPGCEEPHLIPDSWSFDGNLEKPTFNPSVKITSKKRNIVDGKWIGGWPRDSAGNLIDQCCHYHLHAGELKFCGDCTHQLNGQTVPLPELPDFLKDQ